MRCGRCSPATSLRWTLAQAAIGPGMAVFTRYSRVYWRQAAT